MKVMTTATIQQKKEKQEPIAMITAYDYPTAKVVEQAGVDMILVGDSLGMVVLGYDSTIPVTVEDMLHHTKAVKRGTQTAMIVTDLPFLSYHGSFAETVEACRTLMQLGGAHAVKLEGGVEMAETISRLTAAGVPVVGHIGLTPQSVHQMGGYKVQGKDIESAKRLLEEARVLEEAGVFSIVLECVPASLAQTITEQLTIPTIGIGAGVECDGQVLVFHDLVGFGSELQPKFVKTYARTSDQLTEAVQNYVQDVKQRKFPEADHSFTMKKEVLTQLYGSKEGS